MVRFEIRLWVAIVQVLALYYCPLISGWLVYAFGLVQNQRVAVLQLEIEQGLQRQKSNLESHVQVRSL